MDLNSLNLHELRNLLKNEELSSRDLNHIFKTYALHLHQNPEKQEEIFKRILCTLQHGKYPDSTLNEGAKILYTLLKKNKDFSIDTVETISILIKKAKDPSFLITLGNILSCITDSDKILPQKAFKIFKEFLENKNHTSLSLKNLFNTIGTQITKQKNFVPYGLALLHTGIKNTQNNASSLEVFYSTLNTLVEEKTIPTSKALPLFKYGIEKKENNPDSLYTACNCLLDILNNDPTSASFIFEIFKTSILHPNNQSWLIKSIYDNMEVLLQKNPEFTPFILDVITNGLQHKENNDSSFATAYDILTLIAKENSSLIPQVLQIVKSVPIEKKHDCWALKSFYKLLGIIADTKKNSIPEIFELIKSTLKHQNNNEYSLATAYTTLASVVKNKQEYAKPILDLLLLSNPNFRQMNQYHHAARLYLVLRCLENKDNFSKIPPSEQDFLHFAQQHLSLSSIPEISYIQENDIPFTLVKKQQRIKTEIVRCLKKNNSPVNFEWIRKASFNIARIFGSNYVSFFDKMQRYVSLHDALVWIPYIHEEQNALNFKSFLLTKVIYRSDKDKTNKCHDFKELEIIAQNWENFSPEEQLLKFKELLALSCRQNYPDYQYYKFATEAALHRIHPQSYKKYEDIYAASLEVPEPFDSSKIFHYHKYKGRFLPRDDPRIAFFGIYTSCCQHLEGTGKECTISSMIDPFSQLFVIENEKGEIIAGSWVWENIQSGYRNVCFDSIETHISLRQNKERLKDFYEIYKQAGAFLIEKGNCQHVSVGNAPNYPVNPQIISPIPLPQNYHDKYSDAQKQTVLAENLQALPFQHESPFFVRKACETDEHLSSAFNTYVFFDRSGDPMGYYTYENNVVYLQFEPTTQVSDSFLTHILCSIQKTVAHDENINIISPNEAVKKILDMKSDFTAENSTQIQSGTFQPLYKITLQPMKKKLELKPPIKSFLNSNKKQA